VRLFLFVYVGSLLGQNGAELAVYKGMSRVGLHRNTNNARPTDIYNTYKVDPH
jgi:hypothetical protein